jgi:hypothetical protein
MSNVNPVFSVNNLYEKNIFQQARRKSVFMNYLNFMKNIEFIRFKLIKNS